MCDEFKQMGITVEHQTDLFDDSLRIKGLADHLCKISVRRQRPETLSNLESEIVLPLLDQLGWDVEDTSVVKPGFQMTASVIDFALCFPPGTPSVLVKIGGLPGNRDPTAAHPFDDCTPRALQLTVSEDALTWRLHFPAGRGGMRNREFARFELAPESAQGMAEAFDRFLAFHAVESGEAWRQAKREYGQKRFAAEAHEAWHRSVQGEEVLRRFKREMRKVVGIAVDSERARRFIQGQSASILRLPDPPNPNPVRQVTVGDRVWVYDSGTHEIVTRRVVDGDPDIEQGEVSRNSSFGDALIGAREGEERELRLPGQASRPIRVVLIGDEK